MPLRKGAVRDAALLLRRYCPTVNVAGTPTRAALTDGPLGVEWPTGAWARYRGVRPREEARMVPGQEQTVTRQPERAGLHRAGARATVHLAILLAVTAASVWAGGGHPGSSSGPAASGTVAWGTWVGPFEQRAIVTLESILLAAGREEPSQVVEAVLQTGAPLEGAARSHVRALLGRLGHRVRPGAASQPVLDESTRRPTLDGAFAASHLDTPPQAYLGALEHSIVALRSAALPHIRQAIGQVDDPSSDLLGHITRCRLYRLLGRAGGADSLPFFHRDALREQREVGWPFGLPTFRILRDLGDRDSVLVCLECIQRDCRRGAAGRARLGEALLALRCHGKLDRACFTALESIGDYLAHDPKYTHRTLIRLLEDDALPFGRVPNDRDIQRRANEVLIAITRRDCGFDPDATLSARQQSIAEWRQWADRRPRLRVVIGVGATVMLGCMGAAIWLRRRWRRAGAGPR